MKSINQSDKSPNQSLSQQQDLDIKNFVLKIISSWYWFVISIFIALILAFLYNRYATPYYKVHSTILLEEGKANTPLSGGMGGGDVFEGFGVMGDHYKLQNQMAVLKSKSLIQNVLNQLDFEISYYIIGDIITKEIYGNTPFRVEWDVEHPQMINTDFFINILPDGSFVLTVDAENAVVYNYETEKVINRHPKLTYTTKKINAGTAVSSENFSFTIYLNEYYNPNLDVTYKFRFNKKEILVNHFKNTLLIQNKPEGSSILELSVMTENTQKGITFLNKLAEVYQIYNLNIKNENANRTVNFITTQLESVSDSLLISENKMQNFQTENKMINISFQTEQLLQQINELDKEKVALETKHKYYKYLKEYIESNQEIENIIAPSAMGIEDPLLNSLISELNNLIIEKSSMTSVKNTEHPKLKRLNAQIESTKNNLLENTSNIISQSEIMLTDVRRRLRYFESMARNLPETEREFINIERKYSLNNEIYTFLLEKLSEAQIAKASNIPDSQIVDKAESFGLIKPNKERNYAIAFSLGMLIPLLILFLKDLFNNNISSDEQIKSISSFPLIGYIYKTTTKYKGNTIVLDKPNSPFSEPYRAILNKLSFYNIGSNNQVIAITSSYQGEGKTFNAINIASIYALTKKKTILLDLDLRRSSIAEAFNLDPNKGLVYYLLGRCGLDEITFKSKHPNLDIIPAGPIPPNPAELLTEESLNGLFDELKKRYDLIIVDTSPVGAVVDTLRISKLFDTIVFVVRQNFTNRLGLKSVLDEIEEHKINRLGIILNNVSLKSKKHGYGYGYGYQEKGKKSKRKVLNPEEVT